MENLQGAVEAILFASGEPVPLSRLAETLQAEKGELEKVLEALSERYNRPESGISLVRLEQSYQFCSSPQFSQEVRDALELRRNAPLSQAALEVLAVVAYHQPVTKAFVDQVRGVDCSGVIATLCQKQLIEEKGRLDLPGRPLLYGTTPEFLRCFSVSSLDELPELPNHDAEKSIEAVMEEAKEAESEETGEEKENNPGE